MEPAKPNFLSNKQRVKFVSVVMPFIDIFFIILIAFTATNKLLSIAITLLNPIIGISFLNLGIKLNKERLLNVLAATLNCLNTFLICWVAGPESPSYLMGISFIGACTLVFNSFRELFITIIGVLIAVTVGSFLAEKSVIDIITSLVILICFSVVLVRLLQFTVLQGEEIETQKKLIEEKNKDIIDSIKYAKRIQNSLLPTNKYMERIFNKKQ